MGQFRAKDAGYQEWAMRNLCGGWKVTPVPCAELLTEAGYEVGGKPSCWRRGGNPFPCSASKIARQERERIYGIARRMGLRD